MVVANQLDLVAGLEALAHVGGPLAEGEHGVLLGGLLIDGHGEGELGDQLAPGGPPPQRLAGDLTGQRDRGVRLGPRVCRGGDGRGDGQRARGSPRRRRRRSRSAWGRSRRRRTAPAWAITSPSRASPGATTSARTRCAPCATPTPTA